MSTVSRGFKRDIAQCIANEILAELKTRFPEKVDGVTSDLYSAYKKDAETMLRASVSKLADLIICKTDISCFNHLHIETDPVNSLSSCIADDKGPRLLISQNAQITRNMTLTDFGYFDEVVEFLTSHVGDSWNAVDTKNLYALILSRIEDMASLREFTNYVFKQIYGDCDFSRVVIREYSTGIKMYPLYTLYGDIPTNVSSIKKSFSTVNLIYDEKTTVSLRTRVTSRRVSATGIKLELILRSDHVKEIWL